MRSLILLVLLCVVSAALPRERLIWLEHYGRDRKTFVNNNRVSEQPYAVLAHYVSLGYRITHHTMAATETDYTSIYTHYSWMLEKERETC